MRVAGPGLLLLLNSWRIRRPMGERTRGSEAAHQALGRTPRAKGQGPRARASRAKGRVPRAKGRVPRAKGPAYRAG